MRKVGTDPPRSRSTAQRSAEGQFFRGPGTRDLDLDTVFEALAPRRRRIVLQHLRSREGEWVPVTDVVDRIRAWESELDASSSVSTERIEVTLVHRHLPKLEGLDVIEYDAERGRATYGGSDRIGRFLELALREGPLP